MPDSLLKMGHQVDATGAGTGQLREDTSKKKMHRKRTLTISEFCLNLSAAAPATHRPDIQLQASTCNSLARGLDLDSQH